MEQVLLCLDTMVHIVVAGFFALVPGLVVWLGALGIGLLVQSLRQHSPFHRTRVGSGSTPACRLARTG